MYERIYKPKSITTSVSQTQKLKKTENQTSIPDFIKSRLKTVSDHSPNDVRMHHSTERPVQFMTHAYAPESEQESDRRLHDRQASSLIRRDSEQNPSPGQFSVGQISKEAYSQRIRTILECFHAKAEKGPWEYLDPHPSLCEDFVENYSEIYPQLEAIAANDAQLQRMLARLDILTNLVAHCNNQTAGSISYTHYHMYGADTFLCDDNTLSCNDKTDVITDPLTAAIDCTIKSITTDTITLENVLWIESFVSFQKGTGQELLRHLLRDDKNRDIDYVALGAYPGTENYYQTTLGMKKLPSTYVLEKHGEIINKQRAIQEAKETFGEQEGMSDADYIKRGLDEFVFYPVYYVTKEDLLEKLSKSTDLAKHRINFSNK